jgi:hypothetical protein
MEVLVVAGVGGADVTSAGTHAVEANSKASITSLLIVFSPIGSSIPMVYNHGGLYSILTTTGHYTYSDDFVQTIGFPCQSPPRLLQFQGCGLFT